MLASASRELVSNERVSERASERQRQAGRQAGRQAVRRVRQTTWRRERRHAGVTFPARVINGSEHTKWRSFTALRCEREERKARGCDGGEGRVGRLRVRAVRQDDESRRKREVGGG